MVDLEAGIIHQDDPTTIQKGEGRQPDVVYYDIDQEKLLRGTSAQTVETLYLERVHYGKPRKTIGTAHPFAASHWLGSTLISPIPTQSQAGLRRQSELTRRWDNSHRHCHYHHQHRHLHRQQQSGGRYHSSWLSSCWSSGG